MKRTANDCDLCGKKDIRIDLVIIDKIRQTDIIIELCEECASKHTSSEIRVELGQETLPI